MIRTETCHGHLAQRHPPFETIQNSVKLCVELRETPWFTRGIASTAKPLVNFVPNIVYFVVLSGSCKQVSTPPLRCLGKELEDIWDPLSYIVKVRQISSLLFAHEVNP